MADQQHNGPAGVPANGSAVAHDGSVRPAAMELPDLFFRARCAAPACKALLGGFHIPCAGGMVVFACPQCGLSTVFKNEAYGIRSVLAGPLVGSKPCPPSQPRTRGQRGGRGR